MLVCRQFEEQLVPKRRRHHLRQQRWWVDVVWRSTPRRSREQQRLGGSARIPLQLHRSHGCPRALSIGISRAHHHGLQQHGGPGDSALWQQRQRFVSCARNPRKRWFLGWDAFVSGSNLSGFTGQPWGWRSNSGNDDALYTATSFWTSSTNATNNQPIRWVLGYNDLAPFSPLGHPLLSVDSCAA